MRHRNDGQPDTTAAEKTEDSPQLRDAPAAVSRRSIAFGAVLVAFSVVIWFLTQLQDDPAATPPVRISPTTNRDISPSVVHQPQPSSPSRTEPNSAPPEPDPLPPGPAGINTPEGQVAYRFALAYNEFSPANPNNGAVWIASWRPLATESFTKTAAASFHQTWAWTWQNEVKTYRPRATDGTKAWSNDRAIVYRIGINRAVVSLLNPDEPTTEQNLIWDVVIVRGNTGQPLVAATYIADPTRVEPPNVDDIGPGG